MGEGKLVDTFPPPFWNLLAVLRIFRLIPPQNLSRIDLQTAFFCFEAMATCKAVLAGSFVRQGSIHPK